ncbi:MAG TPA: preprotein translocase subunit SecA [Steroidobacteraceae bacterium]|nr:preprotein translocase subunit SecA [Steroidobacteraceae bacterium]
MLDTLKRIFGSRNDRLIRGYGRYIRAAKELEPGLKGLSDEALRAKTEEFRQRLRQGATLDDLLPEAFAVVREAAWRTLKMRHFDVQLIGGIALHTGKIAEMRTGEGKTLVATLPAYLNALAGEGVHVVTVNEYLAQRDADWMGPVYRFLGLTVGVIKNSQTPQEKREAYACDITYGTNNELGFDYLRDNLAFSLEDRVQRHLAYAIVDEVDSILIDEARTPLIISGPAEESTELYLRINELVPSLERQIQEAGPGEEEEGPGDYAVDEKQKQVHITEQGHERVEALMLKAGLLREGESLYDPANIRLMHHLNAALRAHALYKRDVEYIVRGGEIIIVDEFTGRTMPGRRWSDGLHQAIEAKEGVRVREENQTVASITFQNYFRLYKKLSGMTGTADTEAPEFLEIYGLEVMVIPTHKPMIRKDMPDFVHLTQDDKFKAIIEDIRECVEREQPVLVGTTSIETSELVSGVLQKEGIAHEVLNAKQHEREAHIVAQAGRPGAVTIATNMAGRGTDIVLGGSLEAELAALGHEPGSEAEAAAREQIKADWQARHEKVVAAGGLHIIGTERHESRRIDNQLRGRSGRQGDPGSSRFYLSMEDNLMRIFGDPVRTQRLLKMAGMKEGEVIESGMLSRQIEKAQRKVEAHNFDIRKQLLLFDDVANDQRKVIYQQRTEIMGTEDVSPAIRGILEEAIGALVDQYLPKHAMPGDWDLDGLSRALETDFNVRVDVKGWLAQEPELEEPALRERLAREVQQAYEAKVSRIDAGLMRHIEKDVMLRTLDAHWRDHLAAMDYLRQGIHLRGYAQQDYRTEYKREAFQMFTAMLDRVKFETVTRLMQIEVRSQEEVDREEEERRRRLMQALQAQHPQMLSALASGEEMPAELAVPAGLPAAARAAMRGGSLGYPGADPSAAPPLEPQGTFVRGERKIGRNEPCPCGSGKKYKHCHGALSSVE